MRFILAAALSLASISVVHAETTIRVGWCAITISAAASPYAVAQKLGWFGERGAKVIVTPLPGSTDCVKEVATGDLPFSVPSIEPVLIIHPQGVKGKIFYTAYQSFGYGIAVPADSPIKDFADLKGKRIGVGALTWHAQHHALVAAVDQIQRVLRTSGQHLEPWQLAVARSAVRVQPASEYLCVQHLHTPISGRRIAFSGGVASMFRLMPVLVP